MSTTPSYRIAISADFLKAFSGIPAKLQSKVREFVEKFRADPTSPGINYEKIHQWIDPALRSVRIDQNYRGVVLKPDIGNVYVLLWVDSHEEAYRWAAKKRVTINAETGSLQIFSVEDALETAPSADAFAQAQNLLFKDVTMKDLRRLGVPEELLGFVSGIRSEEELDAATARLPQEAAEGLYMLAAGYSIQEALLEREMKTAAAVDTTDYNAALDNPDSRRRFYVVDDAMELAEIMNAPLDQWRIFLHPSQRSLAEMTANGPVKVLGGAGTGKTVVAMHRAKYLAEHVFTEATDRILFTTYTKNLAADILENLRSLCPAHVLRRIEVINIDSWVSQFLRQHGYKYKIVFSEETAPLWDSAMTLADPALGLPCEFYKVEWETVVQVNGVSALDEYLRVPRIGRGKSLSRIERAAVWKVFEEYRSELQRSGSKELVDAVRDARLLLNRLGDVLPYRAVVVDEAQDLGMETFKLLRAIVPSPAEGRENDLFIVGDGHQRIYGHKVVLSKCSIETRGRSRKLRVNYRTTEETKKWATEILMGRGIDDLDGGPDTNKGYISLLHGDRPLVQPFATFSEEVKAIIEQINELQAQGTALQTICLIARTNELVLQYEGALSAAGVETYRIRRSESENGARSGVRLATMHRVKGLEFDYVLLAGINEGIVPLSQALQATTDAAEREDKELNERSILYVAATRAKKNVYVTSFGTPSALINTARSL